MKKIIYLSLLIFISFTSCVDLDMEPVDAYSSSTYFKSEKAALANLMSVYATTKMSGFFEDGNTMLLDDITDNGYCPFTNQLPYYIALGASTPSLTGKYADFYTGYFSYTGIRNANYFLENIDNVSMDEDTKEQMKAEVKFLRAFNYARKMMLFGGVPLVTKTLQYGEEIIPRNTEEEIYNFVITELTAVAPTLPLTRGDEEKGRITRGAALAIKARVELFKGDYDKAEIDAKAVMDLNIYDLYSDYEGLFWEKNQEDVNRNKEAILEVCYNYPDLGSWLDAFYTVVEGGWNSINPTQSIVDAYETKNGKPISEDPTYDPNKPYENRDPRFYASIIYPGASWNGRIFNSLQNLESSGGPDEYYNSSKGNRSKTGYCLRKYCAPTEFLHSESPEDGQALNYIVIRYSEVLLTYAEALIEQNKQLDIAAQIINKVRNRAGMPNVTETDQVGLRKRIRNERRVEFAFEGLRWFDIKRWKIGTQVLNGPVYGVRPGTIDMSTGVISWTNANHITVGDEREFDLNRDYYFPIPQSDIDSNSALKQNPNW